MGSFKICEKSIGDLRLTWTKSIRRCKPLFQGLLLASVMQPNWAEHAIRFTGGVLAHHHIGVTAERRIEAPAEAQCEHHRCHFGGAGHLRRCALVLRAAGRRLYSRIASSGYHRAPRASRSEDG